MKTKAFSLLDLVIVIAVAGVLAFFLLPPSRGPHTKAPRIHCVNNLKQVGLAFRVWAADHGERMPNQVPAIEGGSMETLLAGDLVAAFRNLSNELSTPNILHCPSDADSVSVRSFLDFGDENASYFLSADASTSNPEALLAGDRNITNGTRLVAGLLNVSSNAPAGWNHKIHEKAGNVAFADGSVQQLTINGLKQVTTTQPDPTRLALPRANRQPMDPL
ncbi:MAG TPA: hypothetical protein VEH04_00075 [Verrucomicrobiae bacterium]|nr:hypothetical protein [Verrucomicrobiae bacterium]